MFIHTLTHCTHAFTLASCLAIYLASLNEIKHNETDATQNNRQSDRRRCCTAKEPYISAKEPYISAKDPYIAA